MCISRVGKVLAVERGKARVEFFDGRTAERIDVSVVGAPPGAYVEVYGDLALAVLRDSEARKRKAAWTEVRRAAQLSLAGVSRN